VHVAVISTMMLHVTSIPYRYTI